MEGITGRMLGGAASYVGNDTDEKEKQALGFKYANLLPEFG